jgi:hypothetical protein
MPRTVTTIRRHEIGHDGSALEVATINLPVVKPGRNTGFWLVCIMYQLVRILGKKSGKCTSMNGLQCAV